ncbi:MAG: DUF1330 domain-containing protein [Ilumatobacteraceae bacterium]
MFEVELLTDPSPHDADGYERYRAAVPELIARFGGRYLVRAGTGTRWRVGPRRTVAPRRVSRCRVGTAVLELSRVPRVKPLRAGAADVRAVLVEHPPG